MIKKINIHALLPVLPKGYLNVDWGGGEDKIRFPSDNKENILSIGHEIKVGGRREYGLSFSIQNLALMFS